MSRRNTLSTCLLDCLLITLSESYPACFTLGRKWDQNYMLDVMDGADTPYKCQAFCVERPDCTHFTWYSNSHLEPVYPQVCYFFSSNPSLSAWKCEDSCVSGPSSCTCSDIFSCSNTGDNQLEVLPSITTEEECQGKCYSTPKCEMYTWYSNKSHPFQMDCFLYSSCEVREDCVECFTGSKECSWPPPPITTSTITTATTTSKTTTVSATTTKSPVQTSTSTSLSCNPPPNPINGYWYCTTTMVTYPQNNHLTCDLECHPGYAADSRTRVICSHGTWNHPYNNLICSPALALITGGQDLHSDIHAELYGLGVHTVQPSMPNFRESHTLDYVDNHIVLCGDFYSNAEQSCMELISDRWFQHSTLIYPRKGHSSVVVRSTLHLLGGHSSLRTSEYIKPLENLENNQWVQGRDMMENTWYSCAVKIHPELFLISGGMGSPKSAWQYNVTSGATTGLADMKHSRYAHGCVYVRDEVNSGHIGVVVAGGAMNANKLSSSEIYSLEDGVWRDLGNLNVEREGVRMVVIQGSEVLAIGGGPAGGHDRHRTVERLNLKSGLWTFTEDMLESRKYHAITAVPNNKFSIKNANFL